MLTRCCSEESVYRKHAHCETGCIPQNEDEHGIRPEGGIAYTRCFDAVRRQLQKINPRIIPVGPEISGDCSYPGAQFNYLSYYLNKSNHAGNYAPEIGSYHIGINGDGLSTAGSEGYYTQWDHALAHFVPAIDEVLHEVLREYYCSSFYERG